MLGSVCWGQEETPWGSRGLLGVSEHMATSRRLLGLPPLRDSATQCGCIGGWDWVEHFNRAIKTNIHSSLSRTLYFFSLILRTAYKPVTVCQTFPWAANMRDLLLVVQIMAIYCITSQRAFVWVSCVMACPILDMPRECMYQVSCFLITMKLSTFWIQVTDSICSAQLWLYLPNRISTILSQFIAEILPFQALTYKVRCQALNYFLTSQSSPRNWLNSSGVIFFLSFCWDTPKCLIRLFQLAQHWDHCTTLTVRCVWRQKTNKLVSKNSFIKSSKQSQHYFISASFQKNKH